MSPSDVNAVTWAVFPGKEIVQSTIIEEVSFLSWKVRRFRLSLLPRSFYTDSSYLRFGRTAITRRRPSQYGRTGRSSIRPNRPRESFCRTSPTSIGSSVSSATTTRTPTVSRTFCSAPETRFAKYQI